MIRFRPRWFRSHEHVSLTGSVAAFAIWLSIIFISGGLGCALIFSLWVIDATTSWRIQIAPRLSTNTLSDRIAWLGFSIGVATMFWITIAAFMDETDGDFRTWVEIRRQSRILCVTATFAVAVPIVVTIRQALERRRARRAVAIAASAATTSDQPSKAT